MAVRPLITLYVDVVSPFAYEAYYILRNHSVFKDCDTRYVPIFLGGLMKLVRACGNTAPIDIKNKDKWIVTERVRWARSFGIPMKDEQPPGFPPATLKTMRALCVIADEDDAQQSNLTRALDMLYRQLWVEHQAVQDPGVLRAVLQGIVGLDKTDNVLERAGTDGKRILAANTDKAMGDGAFGLPWMVCTNRAGQTEGFWGVDHLGQVVQFLDLKHPAEGSWKALL